MASKKPIDRLARDAAAAHAAGMSYGKWRMQQYIERQRRKAAREAAKREREALSKD